MQQRRSVICHIIFWLGITHFPIAVIGQEKGPILAFTSDTQAPLLVERAIRKINHNKKATDLIFHDIVSRRPACLIILGDLVSLGYMPAKWKEIDTCLQLFADRKIPVYAVLGNHELMVNPAKGRRNFQARFPSHSFLGYREIVDSVGVILLNSNFGAMTDPERITQDNWYNNTIKEMEHDSAIKMVIVGCHHSPYTNSKAVKPSLEVRREFLPAFLHSKKCVLFLSGHSHNFEQFEVEGKCFLVIGGGGGPHQPLHKDNQPTPDLANTYKPMFHYLEVRRLQDSLQVISRQLLPDFSGFRDGMTFTVGPGCSDSDPGCLDRR